MAAIAEGVTNTLTVTEKQKVTYCIPLWLRDEQVKLNTARVRGRIRPAYDTRADPIAVVNFGPSLNETWEQIRRYRYVISCSGSHKFLLEHGIVPTWHVDVDPREHKCLLLGTPHKEVEYLISSACHPKLFALLEGFNVKLWHVFTAEEDPARTLPAGEWALTGGCSAGLRTMTIARFLGFKNLHIFGMDGCEGASGSHADEHPNRPKSMQACEYQGVSYRTTPAMLAAAQETFHELDLMPDVKPTFYGEGLVQAMARDWVRKSKADGLNMLIAYEKPKLISDEMRRLNAQLHQERLEYGVAAGRHAPMLLKMMAKTPTIKSVLDYGCGKGYLAKALPFPIWEYDPAIAGKEESPRPADLVCCFDVLEHIEPDKLEFVLGDLGRCVKQVGLFVIHTGPAKKSYADGRNTHLIQKPEAWWRSRLERFFKIAQIFTKGPELYVVVSPRKN
jgi:hypothetical protein